MARSVLFTIIGMSPSSRGRLNALCDARRRRAWSAPSDTIIEPGPTTSRTPYDVVTVAPPVGVGALGEHLPHDGRVTDDCETHPADADSTIGPYSRRSSSSAGAGSSSNTRN